MGLVVKSKYLRGMASENMSGFDNNTSETTYTMGDSRADTGYFIMGALEYASVGYLPCSSTRMELKTVNDFRISRHVTAQPTSSGLFVIEEDGAFETTPVLRSLKIEPGGAISINHPVDEATDFFSNVVVSGNTISFDTYSDISQNLPENIYSANCFGEGTDPAGTTIGGGNIISITRTSSTFTVTFKNNDLSTADALLFGLQFVWFGTA